MAERIIPARALVRARALPAACSYMCGHSANLDGRGLSVWRRLGR